MTSSLMPATLLPVERAPIYAESAGAGHHPWPSTTTHRGPAGGLRGGVTHPVCGVFEGRRRAGSQVQGREAAPRQLLDQHRRERQPGVVGRQRNDIVAHASDTPSGRTSPHIRRISGRWPPLLAVHDDAPRPPPPNRTSPPAGTRKSSVAPGRIGKRNSGKKVSCVLTNWSGGPSLLIRAPVSPNPQTPEPSLVEINDKPSD